MSIALEQRPIPPTPLAPARRMLLAVLPLSTGAALVTLIVARFSMPMAAVVVATIGLVARHMVVSQLDAPSHARLRRLTVHAACAGVVATLAYDAVRFGIVAVSQWSIRPFHAWPRFGQQFVGPSAPEVLQWVVGFGYHLLNGIGFAVAYAMVVRRPRLTTAVAWAMGLESAMVLMYPDWLGVNLTTEFTVVSVAGHLAWAVGLHAVLSAGESNSEMPR